jgi:hypothetical protein
MTASSKSLALLSRALLKDFLEISPISQIPMIEPVPEGQVLVREEVEV